MFTCAASPRPVCSLSEISPKVIYSHREKPGLQRGWGMRGEEAHRVGRENDPAAPWPPGGKQVFSELSISVSSQCSLVKEDTPEAEPGSVCPHTPPPDPCYSISVRTLALVLLVKLFLCSLQVWRPFHSAPEPRETTKQQVLLRIVIKSILQIRKLRLICPRSHSS